MAAIGDENAIPRSANVQVRASMQEIKAAPRPTKRSFEEAMASENKKRKTCVATVTTPAQTAAPPTKRARLVGWLLAPFRRMPIGSTWFAVKQRQASGTDASFAIGASIDVNWVEDDCDEEDWHPAVVCGFDGSGNLRIQWEVDGTEDIC